MDSWDARALRALQLGCVVSAFVLWGCGDDDDVSGADAGEDGGVDVGNQAGSGGKGGTAGKGGTKPETDAGGSEDSPLLDAPEADMVASLELDSAVDDVVYAEDLALGLHEESGVSILDLSDPKNPKAISKLDTTGRAVGVALDPRLRVLFIVTETGDLRAYRVADVTGPAMIAQATIAEPGESGAVIRGLVRVGYRLMLLGKSHLLPVQIQLGNAGSLALLAESDVALDADPERIEVGGGVVFVAFKGGKVQIWSATSSPAKLDEHSVGADIAGWVVRGRRLFLALRTLGLRVVDMTVPGKPRTSFEATELDDLEGLKRFGNLVLVSLARGSLLALDLSDFAAPRTLVKRGGTLPKWIAPIGGNLLLGTGKLLSVFGVPPFVSASVPSPSAKSFPRYGRIPLQLSKPVDPATVTVANVKLSCGGTEIEGTVVISLDNLHITFMPSTTLPAGEDCSLSLGGVKDTLGLELSAGSSAMMAFTTAMDSPAEITNPHSSYAHTADGLFTDFADPNDTEFEYFDVTGARGMYSNFYADYDGSKLWLLNDWFYNGDDIEPDCYNQFGVWTGGGAQQWEIRAYGDQHIEVRLNGTSLEDGDERVTGGYARVATPNDPEPHTVYEISITTEPGAWGVQLHDPGPTFSCHRLESDPTNYLGSSTADSSTIDPTRAPAAPPKPALTSGSVVSTTPTLNWAGQQASSAFTTFVIELSSGEDLSRIFYRVVVYGSYFTVPEGLLVDGMTYTWRVTAYNLAGTAVSESATFTVGTPADVGAPTLSGVDPSTVTMGAATTLTLNGTGFVQGARAYFNGYELATTYVSDTQLTAMLPANLAGTQGVFGLAVLNLPGDASTASASVEVTVAAQSTTVGLGSITPTTINAMASTAIGVTLTNGVSEAYYLILTPHGTQQSLEPVFCDWTGNDHCDATVYVTMAGTYDVKIRVGSVNTYDTNTIDSGLVVNAAPAACAHDECLPGARLASDCSACAMAVCNANQACCSTSWGSACVTAAATSGSCSCSPVKLSGLSPNSQNAGESTQVMADLQNAVAGLTYTLVLTEVGQIDGTAFPCAFNQGTSDCTATVVNLPHGTDTPYNAHIQVSDAQSVTSYVTNTLDSAFTVHPASTCPAATCSGTVSNCGCSGGGYTLTCTASTCECRNAQDQLVNDGSGAGVCDTQQAMQNAFMLFCCGA